MEPPISTFFDPKGVVIVGASAEPGKLGYAIARNMVQCGYQGAIHFNNIKGGELFGHPIYRSAVEVPDPVDLAVSIVPAAATPAALEDLARRGIRAVIICSGGFRETGPEGAKLEAECLEIARNYQMRLIGPNCIGLIDNHLPLDTSFLTIPAPPKGNLALLSQSGAVCCVIIDWAQGQGFGFSHLLSLGNEADISEADLLPGLVEDENTRVITFYIESIRQGRRFMEEAARASRRKALVAMKVGRSAGGQRAAASHTGALAGTEAAYEAAFERAGILQAGTIEEMVEWAEALAGCPLPHGRRMAILTNAGGPGAIAADALEANSLRLAELSPETQAGLAAITPSAASFQNPVDMLGGATSEMFAGCLQRILADPGVDGVLVILPPPPVDNAEMNAAALIPLIQASSKPVIPAVMGGPTVQKGVELFRQAGIPEYGSAERAVSALAALVRRAESLERLEKAEEETRTWENIDPAAARASLKGAQPEAFLASQAAGRLAAAYGIRTAPIRLAGTEAEAVEIAGGVGYPAVLKVASADIPHKSDVGGVLVNLKSEQEIREGFNQVIQNARLARPEAHIEGVLVQHMLTGGQEVIVGAKCDPQFGPLMMFGSGGVDVEGLKDVAFGLAPLRESEAQAMLQRTWAGRKLAGFRSIPAADAAAVKEVLQRLAQLALDFPEIAEIEINPLLVLAPGEGAVAVDVRVKLG